MDAHKRVSRCDHGRVVDVLTKRAAGVIMLMSLWLFGDQFQHIVAVSFTALIINELLMVAYEIHTWCVVDIARALF